MLYGTPPHSVRPQPQREVRAKRKYGCTGINTFESYAAYSKQAAQAMKKATNLRYLTLWDWSDEQRGLETSTLPAMFRGRIPSLE